VQAALVRADVTPTAEADATYGELKGYLDSEEAQGMSHSDLEREVEARGRELLRLLMQAHLDGRGPGEAVGEVVGRDGVERPEARLQTRELETVFGTVVVERLGYGAAGVESLHPKDAALNLPEERYSLEVRRRVAEEAARGSFEEAAAAVERTTGAHVPKRQAEELVARAAQDFDAFYEQRRSVPDEQGAGGEVLVLSVDGKGVVMRREDLRDATRKAAAARKHKLQTRLTKGEKRNAKRMATVGAVYTIAPYPRSPEQVVRSLAGLQEEKAAPRPRPEGKRVMASLKMTPAEVVEEIFADALHRDPERAKTWVAVVDGNKPQLKLLEQQARRHKLELTIVLDTIHVAEYLWKAGAVLNPPASPALEAWVQHRLLEILHGRSSLVAAGMRRSATRRDLSKTARKPVDTCAKYLLTYRPYLRYDDYLARGLPIASGVIEGACRYLVKDRMDLTGARWSLTGAEAVLRLRALRSSGDFDVYWRFHEAQEHRRNHADRYAGGVAPDVKLPRSKPVKRRLRLVE
jgi:hypothetical protein